MAEEKTAQARTNQGISRRKFIAAASAGVVVGVAAGVAGGYFSAPRTPQNLVVPIPSTWDQQTDVAIVGGGGAGLAAAVGALEAGASVVVLEKGASTGGETALSGGWWWVPNSSLAKAAGITKSSDSIMSYLSTSGGGQQDADLITTYLQQAPAVLDHFSAITNVAFHLYQRTNDSYNLPMATPVGDSCAPDGAGAALTNALKSIIDGKGGKTMVNTAVTSLYKDATGRIQGVKAVSGSSTVNISTSRGVILAAGGFDHNDDMVAAFMRGPIDYSAAPETVTGDGVLMAMAAGAQMRNMNNCWGTPFYLSPGRAVGDYGFTRGKPGAIVVNRFGKRFADESSQYAVFNRAFHMWDTGLQDYINIPAYTIIDSDYFARYGFADVSSGGNTPSYVTSANTLGDLASALNISPSGLQATVAQFNTYATNGVDPDFGRGEPILDKTTNGDPTRSDLKNICLAPLLKPPFYGQRIHPGMLGTCGGPRINSNGQVLDQGGNPIPGLYGAGNDVAALWGAGYPGGGGTIGPAMVFGYLAGKYAGSS